MPQKQPLHSIVKLREQVEDRARLRLGDAQRRTVEAELELVGARDRTRRDERRRGSAVDWEVAETAQVAALRDVRQAEDVARTAADALAQMRAQFVDARARAEAMRRLSQLRSEAALREVDARERKDLDEVAISRHRHARR